MHSKKIRKWAPYQDTIAFGMTRIILCIFIDVGTICFKKLVFANKYNLELKYHFWMNLWVTLIFFL